MKKLTLAAVAAIALATGLVATAAPMTPAADVAALVSEAAPADELVSTAETCEAEAAGDENQAEAMRRPPMRCCEWVDQIGGECFLWWPVGRPCP